MSDPRPLGPVGVTLAAALLVALPGCRQNVDADARTAALDRPDPLGMLGGCILVDPIGEVPENLHQVTGVVRSYDYSPLTKTVVARGLTLAGGDAISDDFMRLVARAIDETLPRDAGIDIELQDEIVRNHYRYRALIPVALGDDFGFSEDEAWDAVDSRNSVCDVIMEGVPRGQVMEVVEHILHYVTDIGLHYTFPDEWGISDTSVVNEAMETAIERRWYGVAGYDDIDEPGVRRRVLIQEFAYWVISTAWDLQRDYGPNEEEWTIRTPEELAAKLPDLWAAYERTVARTMAPPSPETLQAIGPPRAEEAATP